MSSKSEFLAAFDDIQGVVNQAAAMPDHREREVESSPVVTIDAPSGNLSVTVTDAKVQSLWLSNDWVATTNAAQIASEITETVNQALAQWTVEQMAEVEEINPDLKQLGAAIQAARAKLDQAWVATLAEAAV